MKIYVAPMAGVTDYAFRQILKKYKPDLMYAEMVNSNLLSLNDETTLKSIMKMSKDEYTGIQLFGSDINNLYDNFLKLKEKSYHNLLLNMGCPQNKITKKGSGASLAERIDDVDLLLSKLKKENVDVSLKIRLSNLTKDYFDLANKYNIPYLCIHTRTKEEKFENITHYDELIKLSKLKRNFELVANGGILSLEEYNKIKDINIDAVMLARGIIGRPWLIKEIRENKNFNPSLKEIKNMVIEHLEYIKEDKGEIKAAMEINKFIEAYFKDYKIDIQNIILEFDYQKKLEIIKNIG